MKKLLATLRVYEDDQETGSHVGTHWRIGKDKQLENNGEWELVLGPLDQDGAKPDKLGVLAHELGHFAAQLLRTPAALRDMYNSRKAQWCAEQAEKKLGIPEVPGAWRFIPEAVRSKYAAESEAWDIARRMGIPVNEGYAEECLETYREEVRDTERWERKAA